MNFSSVVILLGALLLAVVILLVIWGVVIRRKTAEIKRNEVPPESLSAVSEAKFEAGEKFASLASEQVEELVKERLQAFPDLADVKIDFATGPDEALVVWIDDQSHPDIEKIPDERIRAAITEAVETFNR